MATTTRVRRRRKPPIERGPDGHPVLEIDRDSLKLWAHCTEREPFVSAYRKTQIFDRSKKPYSIYWKSRTVIHVERNE